VSIWDNLNKVIAKCDTQTLVKASTLARAGDVRQLTELLCQNSNAVYASGAYFELYAAHGIDQVQKVTEILGSDHVGTVLYNIIRAVRSDDTQRLAELISTFPEGNGSYGFVVALGVAGLERREVILRALMTNPVFKREIKHVASTLVKTAVQTGHSAPLRALIKAGIPLEYFTAQDLEALTSLGIVPPPTG
jgi:hypothetical protein